MPLTEKELIEKSWALGLASEGNQNLDEDNLCCFTNEALQVIHSKDRALWLARAMRAKDKYTTYMHFWDGYDEEDLNFILWKKWQWVERKCREKAKEFE